MRPEDFIAAISLIGLTGAVFYMVRKPTEDGPSDYAEPFGHIPARVYLPSPRPSDRGGSPLSAAPVPSRLDEIEDDEWITVVPVFSSKHNRSVTDD